MLLKLLGVMDLISALLFYLVMQDVHLGGLGTWFCMYLIVKGIIFMFMGSMSSFFDMFFGIIFGIALLGAVWHLALWIGIFYLVIKGGMSLL